MNYMTPSTGLIKNEKKVKLEEKSQVIGEIVFLLLFLAVVINNIPPLF